MSAAALWGLFQPGLQPSSICNLSAGFPVCKPPCSCLTLREACAAEIGHTEVLYAVEFLTHVLVHQREEAMPEAMEVCRELLLAGAITEAQPGRRLQGRAFSPEVQVTLY